MSAGARPDRLLPAEHHMSVRRTARYFTLGEPAAAREVWFVLHGYGQLARRFIRHFRPLATEDRLLVAPEALNRYYSDHEPGYHRPDARVGGTWMTREDRLAEIDDYVDYLDALQAAILTSTPAARGCVLLGFSQGAATAARWAALGKARFRNVILWGGLLPPDLSRQPGLLHGAQLTLAAGRGDPHATIAQLQTESAVLTAAGVAHRVRWFDGGHELHPDTLLSLAGES